MKTNLFVILLFLFGFNLVSAQVKTGKPPTGGSHHGPKEDEQNERESYEQIRIKISVILKKAKEQKKLCDR